MTEHEPAANGPAPARARLLLLLAVVIWGFTFVATKICLVRLDPLSLLAARFVIALPALALVMRLRRRRLPPLRRARSVLLASAIFLAHFMLQVTGLRETTATNTGWIIAITPLVLALLSRPILGERIGRRTAVGILTATVGVLLLVSGGDPRALSWNASRGDLLVLASAHTWALYTIAIRRLARSGDSLADTVSVLLPATVVLVLLAAPRFEPARWAALGVEGWLALAFLGILGTALAQWFWQVGVARIGATRAGTFLYLEPLATTALAVPYLGEQPGPATLGGGLLVLAGVALAQRPSGSGVG